MNSSHANRRKGKFPGIPTNQWRVKEKCLLNKGPRLDCVNIPLLLEKFNLFWFVYKKKFTNVILLPNSGNLFLKRFVIYFKHVYLCWNGLRVTYPRAWQLPVFHESESVFSGPLLLSALCATTWQDWTQSHRARGLEVVENRLMKQIQATHSLPTNNLSNYWESFRTSWCDWSGKLTYSREKWKRHPQGNCNMNMLSFRLLVSVEFLVLWFISGFPSIKLWKSWRRSC